MGGGGQGGRSEMTTGEPILHHRRQKELCNARKFLLPPFLPSPVTLPYRMDYDEERGGMGGGAVKAMQRQGMPTMDTSGGSSTQ